ncbi:MAG: hypothetical protein AAGH79_02590, partial [Bacteroidota bacterium]
MIKCKEPLFVIQLPILKNQTAILPSFTESGARKTLWGIVTCLFLIQCAAKDATDSFIFQRLQPQLSADFHHTILVGTYPVFEDPIKGEGRTIPLHVEIIPALHRENLQPPLFLIDGGPGIGVSNW